MTILKQNKNYKLGSFIAGCRVWYAIYDLKDEVIFCNNDYNVALKKFNSLK